MLFKFLYFTVLCLAVPLLAYAQPSEKQNPCKDSLLLKLKKIPQVSLNMAERKYLEQKEKECAEFAKSQTLQKDTTVAQRPESDAAAAGESETKREGAGSLKPVPEKKEEISAHEALSIAPAQKDTSATMHSEMEPWLTARNAGIVAFIAAAIAGIVIALGSVTPSPF